MLMKKRREESRFMGLMMTGGTVALVLSLKIAHDADKRGKELKGDKNGVKMPLPLW